MSLPDTQPIPLRPAPPDRGPAVPTGGPPQDGGPHAGALDTLDDLDDLDDLEHLEHLDAGTTPAGPASPGEPWQDDEDDDPWPCDGEGWQFPAMRAPELPDRGPSGGTDLLGRLLGDELPPPLLGGDVFAAAPFGLTQPAEPVPPQPDPTGPTGPTGPTEDPGAATWPGGPDAAPQPGEPSVLDSRWSQDSQVTRLLCATTHLHGEYAEDVVGALLDPSFTAIAPSWGLDPVALAQHAKLASARRRERDRSLRYLLAGMVLMPAVIVALALSTGLSPFNVALSIILVIVAGFAAAWMIVFAHYELIRLSALEAMNGLMNPRDTAPALDPGTTARLEGLAEGNVVVFGGYQPFVGCGVTLDSWTVCVDLKPGGDGPVVAFDPLDLQQHLLRTVPPQTPGGLWAASRLFVGGTAAATVPGLVPNPRDTDTWPATCLPQELLDSFTREPSETARTYTCLAHPAWRGEIVVSMLTRAEIAGTKLFVEGRTHALLPPRATFREVKYVPKHPRRARVAVARSAAAVVVPVLLGSYQRKVDLMKTTYTFKRNRERLRRDLAEGHPFNYGANSSPREDVAEPSELKYYAAVDEVRSFRILKRQILDAVAAFLAERGLDAAEFRRQAELSLGETVVHLHDLDAAEDSFGPGNSVTVGR